MLGGSQLERSKGPATGGEGGATAADGATPVRRWLELAPMLVPGALTVYLSFNAGGFFPGAPALVAVALALGIVLRLALAPDPFEGLSPLLGAAVAALCLYAVWTLVSAFWSDSPARSLIEFDRALLYLLALVLFGSLRRRPGGLSVLVWGLAAAAFVVSLAAFVSRALPELFSVGPGLEVERLSFPLTYWNALGVLAAIGLVLCLALTTRDRERPGARVLAAAALPTMAATLALTYSRGALLVAAAGAAVYVVLSRQRGLLTGVPVAAVVVAGTLVATYGADLLASADPVSPAAVEEGGDLVTTIFAITLGAALARALLVMVDRRLARVPLPPERARRAIGGAGAAAVAAAVLVAVLAFDAGGFVERQYDRLVDTPSPGNARDVQSRLTDPAAGSRIEQWRVAVDGFRDAPLAGNGAGTYELLWTLSRPQPGKVVDAHSLYLEVLAELGVVGLAALAVALLAILVGLGRRIRGPDRALQSVLFALALAWLGHAALDWDWEMPAITLWLFCAGGAVLASSVPRRASVPRPLTRLLATAAVLAVTATPALIAVSQLHLSDAEAAARAGDCEEAIDSALASAAVLSVRPEPYKTLGYCDLRLGAPRLADAMFSRAVAEDPENWRYHYGLAIARAANGDDPRPDARTARRLNPVDPQTEALVELFATDEPKQWTRRAEKARPALD
jgi:O-antigen ligase